LSVLPSRLRVRQTAEDCQGVRGLSGETQLFSIPAVDSMG